MLGAGMAGFRVWSLILGEWRSSCCRTSPRSHVQQIIPHAMLRLALLQGMVMDHDYFVLVGFGHRKPVTVTVDLMGFEFEKRSVRTDIGNRS